ncbi:Glucose-responsive transcription factor [Friedmanniomyces endolithicus]|nr:Glucose-responsive transcription factor [Friedmanniomyces endolithicus]
MSSTAGDTAAPRYPSPQRHGGALPFYRQPAQYDPDRTHQMDRHQNEDVRMTIEGDGQAQQQQGGLPIPDDPQLRANLATMAGSYGGGYGVHMQPGHQPHGLPQGPMTFAQPAGSPDTSGLGSAQKGKERTKVSRACDECRRKKIRCDAADETGESACSNCGRTSATCAFSRQPMKRGPSKGYIKELAERLNSLEHHVQVVPHSNVLPQARYDLQQVQQAMAEEVYRRQSGVAVIDPRVGDKRTRDVAEGLQNGQVHAGASRQMYEAQRTMPPDSYTSTQQQPTTPISSDMQPFWRRGASHIRHETSGLAYENDNGTTITAFDWDERVIDEYYRLIHQTFPLLPNSKQRLRQRLADCPASLREAFLVALDCLMRTFPTTTLPPNVGYHTASKRAAELLARYPFDNPSTHTNSTNLVYLQSLLLMALESDNHGPATIRGQAGPSRAEWLGRAAGVAGQLEINVIRKASNSVMEGDRDSEERLARRVWWVLFILDRWHASSTAELLKLPENSVVLLPEDQILLGESTYHLARLSFIIGHLAAILTTTKTPSTDVMAPSNPASSLLVLTLAGEIDRFRESVESVWGSLNLVHLSYHHCHLLIKRLNPMTEPVELVGHTVKVATVLNSRLTPVTPLNHHFAALSAMTLCELCDIPKTRSEAIKGLEQMVECLGEGRGLAGKEKGEGWDEAIRELVVGKKERMLGFGAGEGGFAGGGSGLEDLANAAVAGGGVGGRGGDGSGVLDPTWLTRYGYLTALGQGVFKTK